MYIVVGGWKHRTCINSIHFKFTDFGKKLWPTLTKDFNSIYLFSIDSNNVKRERIIPQRCLVLPPVCSPDSSKAGESGGVNPG